MNVYSAGDASSQQQQLNRDRLSAGSSGDTDADKMAATEESVTGRDDDDDEEKIPDWIRCSPADLYFRRDSVIALQY